MSDTPLNSAGPSKRDLMVMMGALSGAVLANGQRAEAGVGAPKSATSFGLRGDGSDETRALQHALDACGAHRWTLALEGDRVYAHAGLFPAPNVSIIGAGDTTELRALDPKNGAIRLTGSHFRIANFRTTSPFARTRSSTATGNGILVFDAEHFELEQVTAEGAEGAAILLFNCRNGRVTSPRSRGSLADALHITNGSRNLTVTDPVSWGCGDDSVAVVSYVGDGAICSDIEIIGGESNDSRARGYAVVGGSNIRITNPVVRRSQCAGIYIASEGSYNTYGCENVIVSGARIYDAVQHPTVSHCGMMVYGREGTAVASGRKMSLASVDCGFVDCLVSGGGRSMRAGVGLDPGSVRAFCKSSRFENLRTPPGSWIPDMVQMSGRDGLIEDNVGDNIGGALVNVGRTASGVLIDRNTRGSHIAQDRKGSCARIYQNAPGVERVQVEGGSQTSDGDAKLQPVVDQLGGGRLVIKGLLHDGRPVG